MAAVAHRQLSLAASVRSGSTESGDDSALPSSSIIEPDSQESDDYGSGESTYSLTSSIINFIKENGRTYHRFREGSYLWPNDMPELERERFQYELFKYVFHGRNYFAPLHNPGKILDIGTGIGTWPIEMGDEFPNAEITGTDLSPVQPNDVPPNVHFVVDDASEPDWLYPHGTFDYIHTRVLLGCFEDFKTEVVERAFKYLKPGGWLESQEMYTRLYCDDGTLPADFPFQNWIEHGDDAAMAFGRPLRIANKLRRWYEAAGFVDVHEEVFKVPLNPWPKEQYYKDIGRLNEISWLDGIQGFSLAHFHRVLGWTKDEIEVYLVNVRKSIQDRSVHAYFKCYVVWGRKPTEEEERARQRRKAEEAAAQQADHPMTG